MTLGKEATSLVIPGGADCGPLELTVRPGDGAYLIALEDDSRSRSSNERD